MNAPDAAGIHEEVWLLLPWLANGRIASAERERAEQHILRCKDCERELAAQRLIGVALSEPDRVTYAPGPSFRKLMERIDDENARRASSRGRQKPAPATGRLSGRFAHVALWRPPGLAWAASFIAVFAITALVGTGYRWSEPLYRTHTDSPAAQTHVLHIAFDRAVTIGDAQELLRTNGARIVEGPGNTGIFGVAPVAASSAADASRQLQMISARLRADSRVLWVQPLTEEAPPAVTREPASRQP